ncbi:prospero homeobox protein 1-like [Archocentrus centrarchus]|uniref:prospero homeobox protein 1-like n=1 Tax=Archocentrus centrarchus TaxID=63155 RepID=UPI0011EA13AD|nr:prospero homeobox protein 1-like [Archocentrus centrarchus]
MNQRVWSKAMYSSNNICLDDCAAEHLSSFQPDLVPSNSDASHVSLTLHRDSENMKTLSDSAYYSSVDAGLMYSSQLDLTSSRGSTSGHLSTRRHRSPAPTSYGHHDWNPNRGNQAKRARVENIIKGMTSPPGMYGPEVTTNEHEEIDCVHDDEKIQEALFLQRHMESTAPRQVTSKQLENQHQHLRQLRTRLTHLDGESEATNWNDPINISHSDAFTDSYSEFESSSSIKYQGWKKVKLMNYFQSKPERIKLMADVLKYELSRVVSKSVDSIFKSVPFLQTSPYDVENVKTDTPLQSLVCSDDKLRLAYCGTPEVQIPDVQTEALSLVVQKPELERSRSAAHHHPKSLTSFSNDAALQEDQGLEENHSMDHQHALRCLQDRCSEDGQSNFKSTEVHWNSVKVRSKVNSRSVRSPQTRAVSVDPVLLESIQLPHVKTESDSLVKSNLYMLNEGLTTNHLKKAKLMFFYTRYPSSLMLKMCFHDVQFTRSITSQLIKWFSNFREFYYIQMEKFARHALIEGVADVRGLTVGRESELFRALNRHYNKGSDFQVPERFLEVAEITLREFYVAISMGKDRDPSWKKAIYKVICKLDMDVPAEFKSPHSG